MGDKKKHSRKIDISQADFKCVWMTAGVVSYKLCDYEYACEECPYDVTIRNNTKENNSVNHYISEVQKNIVNIDDTQRINKLINNLLSIEYRSGVYYSQNHLYVNKSGISKYYIGVDNICMKLLPYITSIVLIPVGTVLLKDQIFCWLVLDDITLALVSPVSGVIKKHNTAIIESPNIIRMDNFENGWLIEIELSDECELKILFSDSDIKNWHNNELNRINRLVRVLVEKYRGSEVHTLYDGGTVISSLNQIFSTKDYLHILTSLLRKPGFRK